MAYPLGIRANGEHDAGQWLDEYRARIQTRATPDPHQGSGVASIPPNFNPWWDAQVKGQTGLAQQPLTIGIDQMIEGALRHSSFIQIISTEPKIRQTGIVEEEAAFDWRAFLETKYTDLNEPIGNTLTTGNNADRFIDRNWSMDTGYKRRNLLGGEAEFSQRFGHQSNNSRFLLPNPQGTTRLELQYSQPLLNGAGRAYNESRILLAQIGANLADDDFADELQSHLLRVTQAYWELYRARAEYFQRQKLLAAASSTLYILGGRQEVDAVPRQVLRAKSAVATRQSEIVRARTSIRNAESQLRLLVNDPLLLFSGDTEFTPGDSPMTIPLRVSLGNSLHTALLNRPDISQAIRDVRASAVRLGVAKNQVLPKLDLLVSSYVAGLEGTGGISKAFGSQFADGRPTFTVGLLFELPAGNRAARARQERRQWEMTRAVGQFRLTVEEALTSVEVASREVETTYGEMASRYQAMLAAENEANYLLHRWNVIPGMNDSATLLLENLLDAQERVADEEEALVRAQVSYAMSVVALKRESGTLLRLHEGSTPGLEFVPAGNPQTQMPAETIQPPDFQRLPYSSASRSPR